ncbi:hypothetical protein BKI52_37890 [marine bacterium AO1-C]|nr:hypothetical protein BKI52_37890 [marine bacterium AO1-C]
MPDDGTEDGTQELKVISDNPLNYISKFQVAGNKLFFVVVEDTHGEEVWVTDGTEAGTRLTKDINPGNGLSYIENLIAADNKVFFRIFDGVHGSEMWVTDGTEAGTKLTKDINPNTSQSFSSQIDIVLNNKVYFTANDGTNGAELWVTDGTEAGTQMVKDINPSGSSSPGNWVVYDNKMYFRANDGTNGTELWVTDGTEAGTQMVKDINPGVLGSNFTNISVMGNKLYFRANDGTHGAELWTSDGTEGGTFMLKDIVSGSESSVVSMLDQVGTFTFFSADDNISGRELWVTDGTGLGTRKVKDINPGNESGVPSAFSLGKQVASLGNKLVFVANDGVHGNELWMSDGTEAGTQLLQDIYEGKLESKLDYFVVMNNRLFFKALDKNHGVEPWVSDGTEAGTKLLKDLYVFPDAGSPRYLTEFNNKLYFQAHDKLHGRELWVSDGTEAGTQLVKDIFSGVNSGFPENLTVFKNKIYFSANGGSGYELWMSDGTEAGTQLVKDIASAPGGSSRPSELKVLNNLLVFVADDGIHGQELWVSDGTKTGTKLLKDITPGVNTDKQVKLAGSSVFNGKLYFAANNGTNGLELWVTDGTEAGTQMLKDIRPGNEDGISLELRSIVFGDKLYFVGNDGVTGSELWTTDGTEAGTQLFKDIYTDDANTNGMDQSPIFTVFDGKLFFGARDQQASTRLWVTDGTKAGTQRFLDNHTLGFIRGIRVLKNQLLVFGGLNLWRVNVVSKAVVLVRRLSDFGRLSLYSFNTTGTWAETEDRHYLLLGTGTYGSEILQTNGDSLGTQVIDVWPGTESSIPSDLKVFQGKLFFTGIDPKLGRELLTYNPEPFPTRPIITDFTPKAGYEGVVVTITGSDFSDLLTENVVKFNGVTATIDSASASQIKVRVPAGATTGAISITVNSTLTGTSTEDFTIQSSITGLSNNTVSPGVIQAYPNPTSDYLIVNMRENRSTSMKLLVYTLNGRLVTNKLVSLKNGITLLDVSHFSSGHYLLVLQQSAKVYQAKFFKK